MYISLPGGKAVGVRLAKRNSKQDRHEVIRASRAVVSNASVWDTQKLLPQGAAPAKWRQESMATPMTGSFMHLHLGRPMCSILLCQHRSGIHLLRVLASCGRAHSHAHEGQLQELHASGQRLLDLLMLGVTPAWDLHDEIDRPVVVSMVMLMIGQIVRAHPGRILCLAAASVLKLHAWGCKAVSLICASILLCGRYGKVLFYN